MALATDYALSAGTRNILALALVTALAACSEPRSESPSRDAAELEAARDEALTLVTGTVADWRSATQAGKDAYSLASASAVNQSSDQVAAGQRFMRCMDDQVARHDEKARLADISSDCAYAMAQNPE